MFLHHFYNTEIIGMYVITGFLSVLHSLTVHFKDKVNLALDGIIALGLYEPESALLLCLLLVVETELPEHCRSLTSGREAW